MKYILTAASDENTYSYILQSEEILKYEVGSCRDSEFKIDGVGTFQLNGSLLIRKSY